MLDKLKSRVEYTVAKADYDFVTLLKLIRMISISGKLHVNKASHYQQSLSKFVNCRQGKSNNTDYLREFKARYAVLKEIDQQSDIIFDDERKAALFIANADGHRYGDLRRDLVNSMALNNDLYPKMLTAAYALLEQYVISPASPGHKNNQQSQPYPLVSTPKCTTSSIVLAQGPFVNPNWILLDSCATVNLFRNPAYLQNLTTVSPGCDIHSTAGSLFTNTSGLLPFLDAPVWFHEEAIANVLSYSLVMDRYPTTASTMPGCKNTHHVIVHLPNDVNIKFQRSAHGLLYHDPTSQATPWSIFSPPTLSLTTVGENLQHFTRRQQEGIAKAKSLYEALGFPGEQSFLTAVAQNQMLNCPVRLDDARNMFQAHGRHIHALRGRTTRHRRKHVPSNGTIPIPVSILNAQRNVTLCIDLFYVDGLVFLLTVSRNLQFITVHALKRRSMMTEVLPKLDVVFNTYRARGFRIAAVHADNEFQTLCPVLLRPDHGHVCLHICGANAHVPEAERAIRTVKERSRATVSHLKQQGIQRYPRLLKRSLVVNCARQMNLFPSANGVSPIFSPLTLVTRIQLDTNLHCRVCFGAYCEVNNEPTPSNTEMPRTTPCLALGPHDLIHGSYWFLSLKTGERIHRDNWTELPVTPTIVEMVHLLADNEQPLRDEVDPFLYEYDQGLPVPETPPLVFTDSQDVILDPNIPAAEKAITLENENGEDVGEFANFPNDEEDTMLERQNVEDQVSTEPVDNETDNSQSLETSSFPTNQSDRPETQDCDNSSWDSDSPETQEGDDSSWDPHEASEQQGGPDTTLSHQTDIHHVEETELGLPNETDVDNHTPNSTQTHMQRSTRSRPNFFKTIPVANERTRRELNRLRDHNRPPQGEAEQEIVFQDVSPLERPLFPDASDSDNGSQASSDDNDKNNSTNETSLNQQSTTESPEILHTTLQSTKQNGFVLQSRSWYNGRTLILFLQNYAHCCTNTDLLGAVTNIVLTQMSAKAGIKQFGDRAVAALLQEFAQLDGKDVLDPINFNSLSPNQRKGALRAISLIKEQRDGRIKGRTVADGRPQRKYKSPEDIYSPTVSTEGIFLSLAIDAKENRHVAVCDVEGAYLHSDMDEFVLMVVEGDMADILIRANPSRYQPFVHTTKSGKKLLYVRLKKALYGCVQSAMLWWKLLSSTLVNIGFEVNPYDNCVANKTMSDGKQCTVCWYVDDLKISHVDKRVVDEVIQLIEGHFGPMTQSHGKKLNYLGMDIEFQDDGTVKLLMKEYLQEALDLFPDDTSKCVTSPAAVHLFDINPSCQRLPEEQRKLLHSITAKLLYVGKRARPDILVPISFLTSRVTTADLDDWKKLKRLLCYLLCTIDLPLILGIDDLCVVHTWVDASFATHHDMRSHTGGVISMGKGALYASSKRQKLNTKSSTESELVGASDFVPQSLWTANFLSAQGYDVTNNILYQDNQSAMKMEKNGRQSAGQRSRHINIRYFFIKDRINKGDIHLIYCPTEHMVADFFSKPLQGTLFTHFRDTVLGHKRPHFPSSYQAENQERVESKIGISEHVNHSGRKSWADVVKHGYSKSMTPEKIPHTRMTSSKIPHTRI